MNWNQQMEIHYANAAMPYNSIGSFMDFFGGVTYDHVNYIFADPPYAQESLYPSISTNPYKFGYSEAGSFSYYDYGHEYVVNDHISGIEEHDKHLENPSTVAGDQNVAANVHREEISGSNSLTNSVECPRGQINTRDSEVVWQDSIDPDNMTYEELLELGEAVGTQSRGLSQDQISLLPITKFKCGLFSRKKSRKERCVVCQMEYKRNDRQITLPCKHVYHAGCGSRWLSINKACPICYTEVVINTSKR
ncbi:E3 ubiquitin-protein ligase BIG BROTHER-like [Lycium barbarum]|uniref:E3 ubiquitin-protein ligase BIG BROTHER-like n=1 Tax=Lycium barbarum TaxID=112863 RepID=UPI00293F1E92|nr:E3 ubiquitin-protein ligase BIG BROTHER-like [Lycium barbarum]XP_060216162.1 E3 ubiquitin-protein ligase BIG BROTHER-like [Lycium barbarum]XP_060216163.1 E3 ubiquitin-protein ligase BIG BROTHER-like [Lycium barbarum]XP_060216164.1 E3 ubiquitin-protein ligase BIG BROTHER-like [Lycium barbarum]XP_060216165.1 E3 ubiquitin-protein ligase BIG BROTHER-like [Lycium barbarum]